MTYLTPQQLLHSADHYRYEKDETRLPKAARKRLAILAVEARKESERRRREREEVMKHPDQAPKTPDRVKPLSGAASSSPVTGLSSELNDMQSDEDDPVTEGFLMNPAHMLQFSLPTSVDMRISYGAGYGGVNRDRERKYIPTVPSEFLERLNISGSNGSFIERKDWDT